MTRWNRRQAWVTVLGLGLAACGQAAVAAWPDKPVRLIVAGPAGGSADIVARLVGDQLTRDTGQPVVVEPKPGAGGVLAVNELSQAPRDGTTLLLAVNSLVSEVPHLIKGKSDMATEVTPLVQLARGGLVLVGNAEVPARTLPELVAWVKKNPGQVLYASYSTGTLSHLLGLQLNQAAGIDMVHVGYKGSTPALTELMGGHLPLMFDGFPTSLPLIRAGRIKAFAVSLPTRSQLLPEVPTFAEAGYPQLTAVSWLGLWCKPDVPVDVQARVRDEAAKVLALPAVRQRLAELGLEPGHSLTTEALKEGLRAEFDRVGSLLKSIDFKPE